MSMLFVKTNMESNEFKCLQMNWTQFMTIIDVESKDLKPAGYLDYIITNKKPELKEGEVIGYECKVENGTLYRTYVAVSNPYDREWQYPRTFSKMKAVQRLMKIGKWEICKQWIVDSGLYDLYLAAQSFREDNEYFKSGLEQIKDKLELTDEQIELFLNDITIS